MTHERLSLSVTGLTDADIVKGLLHRVNTDGVADVYRIDEMHVMAEPVEEPKPSRLWWCVAVAVSLAGWLALALQVFAQ